MRSVPSPVAESTWVLLANGERIGTGTASPGMDRELAAGLLVADGFVRSPDDVLAIDTSTVVPATRLLETRLPPDLVRSALAERQHRLQANCDLLHFVACEPDLLRRERTGGVPDRDELAAMLQNLFELCDRHSPGGGVHGAALTDGDTVHAAVDVGRHCAVDKAIGAAFLDRASLPELGLVVTSRISGRMAVSAARAGVAWVASRSLPTTLAVAIGSAAGLTLVARAASRDFHIFSSGITGDNA